MATLDTLAIARTLTDAGADPKLADAITAAVRVVADHGDHVTPDQFKAVLAEVRTGDCRGPRRNREPGYAALGADR